MFKEYNYVPEKDLHETTYSQDINEIIDTVSGFVKENTEDYDFMDLLDEEGYQSVNDNWTKTHSKDNALISRRCPNYNAALIFKVAFFYAFFKSNECHSLII